MQSTGQLGPAIWQRTVIGTSMVALSLLAGVAPALHQHEVEGESRSHCHDWGRAAATHLETAELAHHEPCGLCAHTLSLIRPERPRTAPVDEIVAEDLAEGRPIPPPSLAGRYGASRAPPSA